MLRTTILFLVSCFILSQASPASKTITPSQDVQCAVCQFMGATAAGKTGGNRAQAIAHCLKFEGCEKQLSDCEIIATLHTEIQKTPEKFEKSRDIIINAIAKCSSDSKALVISEDPSVTQCMLCFLVYDVLKYINYNILENPMLGNVKGALETACILLNEGLCQALLQPDTLGAIVRGIQDSLGGFYDLIAVQGFGCPQYTDLFGQCPGH